jgi:ribosome-associated protein
MASGVGAGGLEVAPDVVIDLDEITLTYVASSGPGGQNVNKVASKAVLRFDLAGSRSLPAELRARAARRLAARLTRGGEIVLTSSRHRDQPRNREAVLTRLRDLLAEAIRPPHVRKRTRPSRTAVQRRLDEKRRRSERKRERRNVSD